MKRVSDRLSVDGENSLNVKEACSLAHHKKGVTSTQKVARVTNTQKFAHLFASFVFENSAILQGCILNEPKFPPSFHPHAARGI